MPQAACYLGQIEPLIGTRTTIDAITLPKVIQGRDLAPNDPCLRYTRTGLLEVYRPIQVVVKRPWLRQPEIEWSAKPGHVLRPIRRRATRGEVELIEAGDKLTKDWKPRRRRGFWTVPIVEKFESEDAIFALIRQLDRHIWASLIGREQDGVLVTYGDKQKMGQAIRTLAVITLWLTEQMPKRQMDLIETRGQIRKMAADMEGVRVRAKVTALEFLTQIAETTEQENLLKLIVEAQRALVSRRDEDIQMAIACAERARWILEDTVGKIDRGVRSAFNRLADLQRELERPIQKGLTLRQLEGIARQIENTFAFLVRVARFNPYTQRVDLTEVTKLRDAQSRAVAFGARGLRNDLKKALAKLEILTKGIGA